MVNIDFKKASQVATDTVFKTLILFVIIALVIGTARIFLDMGKIYSGSIETSTSLLQISLV